MIVISGRPQGGGGAEFSLAERVGRLGARPSGQLESSSGRRGAGAGLSLITLARPLGERLQGLELQPPKPPRGQNDCRKFAAWPAPALAHIDHPPARSGAQSSGPSLCNNLGAKQARRALARPPPPPRAAATGARLT